MDELNMFNKEDKLSKPFTSWNFPLLHKFTLCGTEKQGDKLRDYCDDKKLVMSEVLYKAFIRGTRRKKLNLQEEYKKDKLYKRTNLFMNEKLSDADIDNINKMIWGELEETWKKERYD